MNKENIDLLHRVLLERHRELSGNFLHHENVIAVLHKQEMHDEIDYALISTETFLGDTLMKHHKKEFDDIECALQKIEEKRYGICEMCGDEIDIERLRIKPHAKYCIICREYVEKQNEGK